MAKNRKRKSRRGVDQSTGAPTPERRAMAAGHIRQSISPEQARVYHCEDAPLDRLEQRGQLDRDRHRNRVLAEAGRRYFEHWYKSGMSPLAAVDLGRAQGGGTPSCGMPTSELAAHHRRQYRATVQALGQFFSAVVDPIVLNEQDVAAVGRSISGHRNHGRAVAVAMDRLRGGLTVLAVYFRMLPKGGAAADAVVPKDPRAGAAGAARLDSMDMTMPVSVHSSDSRQERPDGTPSRALSRHRSLAGMS